MERGPMALFGAIIAVGLGPAMWLGAQLGAIAASPHQAPVVSSEQQPNEAPEQQGSGAAGLTPEDPSIVLETKQRATHHPLRPAVSRSASASSATDEPHPVASSSAPSGTISSPSPSAHPSMPPTEVTTEPSDPPTEDDSGGAGAGGSVPPSPPPTSSPQD